MDSSELTELASLPLDSRLTAQFYAWEKWGRGWSVWPSPVALEPPFRPFHFHSAPASLPHGTVDDGRKPTLLSRIFDAASGRDADRDVQLAAFKAWAEDLSAIPDPVPWEREAAPVELRVTLPDRAKTSRDAAEQLLISLSSRPLPVAFEVVGLPDSITYQLVCSPEDYQHVRDQLQVVLPGATLLERSGFLAQQWTSAASAEQLVVDFGLADEFMCPLGSGRLDTGALTAVIGALAGLDAGEIGVFQVLFAPALAPWARSIMRSVTDDTGGSFFADAPEMVRLATEKTSEPLFGTVLRVGIKSPQSGRIWQVARQITAALGQLSCLGSNRLIPLENDEYPDDQHEADLLRRQTHRSGMLLNVSELASLAHLPVGLPHPKLAHADVCTRAAPSVTHGHALVLGENVHQGTRREVTIPAEVRLRHTHVIGASGTGKSTFLLNLITQDLQQGVGFAVLDPHGDLVDEVLLRVPEHRIEDVILVDPSDAEFPVGANILSAHSETEKTLLASDLVGVFRRLSTSWGDQMTSVLGNAVLAFLESERGGTLSDLRRFLVEKEYRAEFLTTVRDSEVVYYWQKEFPLLQGRPQAPLLTRLDTFLRPKLVRNIVSQKSNTLDLSAIMNEGKVLLVKLAHGAIGEENAALLGTLFVAKFHQITLGRQELKQEHRRPFYLYLDEFANFITPSMASILTGARKYGLGLVMAHQELRQLLKDSDVCGAVLSNAATRVCFRVGESDAAKLAEGFSSFTAEDILNLETGEAICRIERRQQDFNLRTFQASEAPTDGHERRERIVALSRQRYATPRREIEAFNVSVSESPRPTPSVETKAAKRKPDPVAAPAPVSEQPTASIPPAPITLPQPGRGGAQHKYLQELIRRWGQDNGYLASVEKDVLDGLGSVDVALEREDQRIACEICVTTSVEHEMENIQKCLAAGFERVVLVAVDRQTIRRGREALAEQLPRERAGRVQILTPEELFASLQLESKQPAAQSMVKGYKVRVSYAEVGEADGRVRRRAIASTVLGAMRKLNG